MLVVYAVLVFLAASWTLGSCSSSNRKVHSSYPAVLEKFAVVFGMSESAGPWPSMPAVKDPAAAWCTSAAAVGDVAGAAGAADAVAVDDQRSVYRPCYSSALAWMSGYPERTLEHPPAKQTHWGWGMEFPGAGQPLNRLP